MKEIGERLRSLRLGAGLTQVQLAAALGIQQSRVNRYESGQSTPQPELFIKLADLYDVSMDFLYCRTDDPHGKYYENQPKVKPPKKVVSEADMREFIEMCFDPASPLSERLKDSLLHMMMGGDAP